MYKRHIAFCTLIFTAPFTHTFLPCTLQPVVHAVSAVVTTTGVATIYQNTKEEADGSYRMTDRKKAIAGYCVTAAACTISALSYIYCNNSK